MASPRAVVLAEAVLAEAVSAGEDLAEEAAEVIHIKSKIIRFGLKDKFGGETGQRRLGCEIGNLLAMVELLVLDGAVLAQDIEDGMARKTESLKEGY